MHPPQILANLESKPVPSYDLILLLFPLRRLQISKSSAVSECANSYICGFFCRSFGWRYGLHLMASIFFGPFFLGTFYRSASLYHPQRRAIIHLKTQQKKQILDRNPVTRPTNIKELKSYKDKSIHFAMISTLLASAGIYTPFVNLVSVTRNKNLTLNDAGFFVS